MYMHKDKTRFGMPDIESILMDKLIKFETTHRDFLKYLSPLTDNELQKYDVTQLITSIEYSCVTSNFPIVDDNFIPGILSSQTRMIVVDFIRYCSTVIKDQTFNNVDRIAIDDMGLSDYIFYIKGIICAIQSGVKQTGSVAESNQKNSVTNNYKPNVPLVDSHGLWLQFGQIQRMLNMNAFDVQYVLSSLEMSNVRQYSDDRGTHLLYRAESVDRLLQKMNSSCVFTEGEKLTDKILQDDPQISDLSMPTDVIPNAINYDMTKLQTVG